MSDLVVARAHTHEQVEPSNLWTIAHPLDCRPAVCVSIYDSTGALQICLPKQVEIPNTTTVLVHFTSPQSGFARLV